jgi:hypothetical protein
MIENRVLRKIFRPQRDEETGQWRRLHMKIFMSYTLQQILIKTNQRGRHVTHMGEFSRKTGEKETTWKTYV